MKNLTYTDENNNKLYGYSQQNLDKNTFWIKIMVISLSFIGTIFLLFFIYILWLTNYIIKNNVINNFIANCI